MKKDEIIKGEPVQEQEPQEAQVEFMANYAPVNEDLARRAKENISFSDYKQGTATARANGYTDCIVEYANSLLIDNPTEDSEKLEKVQNYIDRYSKKIAGAIDKENSITCRCPSILITGGGNFPVRKKEKQNAAAEAHWRATKELYETDNNNYYFNKIRLILTDSGIIKSDDKNAVQKIKDKIAKLEQAEIDKWGYNKTEIRRLKERLLQLAQFKAEAKEQKQEDRKESIKGEDVTVKENTELMRLQILFEGIPAKETRDRLKSNGFKWSPSQGAWQRLLNDNAKRALTDILDK